MFWAIFNIQAETELG